MEVFLEMSFPRDEVSELQKMIFKVSVYQDHTVKIFLYQSMVIFNRNN